MWWCSTFVDSLANKSSKMIKQLANFVFENATISLVLTVALLYIIRVFTNRNYGKRLPPGPWNFPIVGQIPFLAYDFDGFLRSNTKRYGDIYRCQIGSIDAIVLNSFKAIKEALIKQGDVFSARHHDYSVINDLFDFKGILTEDGQVQKDQRRFALSAFRDFGLGRETLEEKIHTEVQRVTDILMASKGKPINIRTPMSNVAANVISSVTMNTNFNYEDKEFKEIRDLNMKASEYFETKLVIFLPWLRHISKKLCGLHVFHELRNDFRDFMNKRIAEHKSTFDENQPRDYLDCHLIENEKRKKMNLSSPNPFDEDRLRHNLVLFFSAGMITTATTLEWCFKMLLIHPKMQEELHQEVDEVIGQSRLASYSDKINMPKTESFLHEIQRFSDIVPFAAPHSNSVDVKLLGYDIPKGSFIMPNLRNVHQDPALWKDPENFRPERFINKEGKCQRPEYLIPFSMGKRACMGENLARMELFLVFVTLLQRFSFTSPDGVKQKLDVKPGLSRTLFNYEVCAEPRI